MTRNASCVPRAAQTSPEIPATARGHFATRQRKRNGKRVSTRRRSHPVANVAVLLRRDAGRLYRCCGKSCRGRPERKAVQKTVAYSRSPEAGKAPKIGASLNPKAAVAPKEWRRLESR